MQDAITNIMNKYDLTGKYLDQFAVNELEIYFSNAIKRIKTIETINSKAATIIKEAAAILYEEQPELLRPGGNSYTTRRYAACLRDIEYYLRYTSYAIIAGNTNILNERVLDGLRDTYNSLNVPLAPTVRSIQILEDIIQNELKFIDTSDRFIISEPFQYIIESLSEQDI
ncbi:allophycocyanin beta-18 subunit (plastid) [Chondrus crispus]|uniref:Allophycocyanin beta-18 subunit n=1 Tax=Chondrus crispus TaxID=2769 RepID=M5DDJ8_CHOCR|nr:allophycocyanin beta-18 subunit [Chondrus crispus]CCP38209.1 allophycocyanin beta-18 subunit [Chondrus crispus]|eukprot:YP_007627462.1 allophycocyanin beta-18 subunit (plastid) [Chondrus crispus]